MKRVRDQNRRPTTVEPGLGIGKLETQALVHVLVEVLEERAASDIEPRSDLVVHLGLQRSEGAASISSDVRHCW